MTPAECTVSRARLARSGSDRHAGAVGVRNSSHSDGRLVAHLLPRPDAMKPNKRILIVDDNPVVQEVLKQFLVRGYQVELATNASPDECTTFLKNENEKYVQIVRSANIRAQ